MLSAVLGIHQTIKHTNEISTERCVSQISFLFAGSEKPHAELNVVEVHDTEICALSVCLIPLLFSLFLLPVLFSPFVISFTSIWDLSPLNGCLV